MKVEQKKEVVKALADKLDSANAFYLTDFTGLNVKNMTDLRARLREADVEYIVVKNRLALRALDGIEVPDVGEFFVGPTGVAIGDGDPVVPAKVLDTFAEDHDDKPRVKAGVIEERTVTAEEITRLAKLPPRDELMAELVGSMQAPLVNMMFALQGLLNEFAGLVEALRAEREGA